MSSLRNTCLLLVGLALSPANAIVVTPKLDPKSSKEFFGKDYPADHRAVADEHYTFDHPYPAVQDTGDYDHDFVKDENSDSGKWKAQMDYDLLRQKLRKADKELERLKKTLDREASEMHAAETEYQETQTKSDQSQEATSGARRAVKDADDTAAKLEAQIAEQSHTVEKEVQDLEECKQQLVGAKQRLKDLLAKQEARAGENQVIEKTNADDAAQQAEEEKREEEEKTKQEKKQKEAKAQEKEDERTEEKVRREAESKTEQENESKKQATPEIVTKASSVSDASWQKKITEERAEYTQASKDYDSAMGKLHETEKQLEKLRGNLKGYRRAPYVDDNGGVYNVPSAKSGAAAWQSNIVVVTAVTVMMMMY